MAPPDPRPFTTCDADTEALARLPRRGLDPTAPGSALTAITQAMLGWYERTGVAPSASNVVVPYVFGRCAFQDIAAALATATAPEHRVYILGWWTDPDTVLVPGQPPVLLRDALTRAKGAIRGMFFDNPLANNSAIVALINSLPTGAAVLDSKVPTVRFMGQETGFRGGAHHQKLLVVSGAQGLIAFTGGMDINNTRVRPNDAGDEPWHDVHVRVTGGAARDLLRVFRQRWLDHPAGVAADQTRFGLRDSTGDFDAVARLPIAKPPPTCTSRPERSLDSDETVGVGRTYANLRKFNRDESYSFASGGEETMWRLIETAVRRARRFIYIEDQYFVSRRLKNLLLTKLRDPQFRFLLVLTTASPSLEWTADSLKANQFPYAIGARNEIRTDFAAVDPNRSRWQIASLKPTLDPTRRQWCGSFVHSKLLIIDDECAIIGTANAADRSYTFDSEVGISVTEDPLGRAAGRRFARDLRLRLWHKHLNVDPSALLEWSKSLPLWRSPPRDSMVFDNSALEDSPLLGPKALLRNFSQANRLWSEDFDPDADLL